MKSIIYQRTSFHIKKYHLQNLSTKKDVEQMTFSIYKKNHPKYIKTFSSTLTENPKSTTTLTIKRMKYIHDISSSLLITPKWKKLLGNNIKHIKNLDDDKQRLSPSLQGKLTTIIQKYFLDLKSLSIQMPQNISQEHPINFRIYETIEKLKRLKHLEIRQLSSDHKHFIEKLNYCPLLKNLNTLSIVCGQQKTRSDNPVLHFLTQNKRLSRNITSLVTCPLECYPYCKSLQLIRTCCPNLSNLRLKFSYEGQKYSGPEINYLGIIDTFQNLKSIHYDIDNTVVFFRDLKVPSSVQHLKLHFQTSPSMIRTDDSFTVLNQFQKNNLEKISKSLEEGRIMSRFYESFRCLQTLQTLEIKFGSSFYDEYWISLTQSILKRITSLKSLVFIPSSRITDQFLPQILISCIYSSETLQTIEIRNYQINCSKLDFSSCQGVLTRLSSLKIIGNFQGQDLQDQNYLLLSHIVSLGKPNPTI